MEWIVSECKKIESALLAARRDLHKIPEIGSTLPRTKKYVCERLEAMGIPYRPNQGDDGIIAEIKVPAVAKRWRSAPIWMPCT